MSTKLQERVYEPFKHWFHDGRGTVFFYSDPHFNDAEQKDIRPDYVGDDEQVRRINSKVGKYDTIVFLGDIGDIDFVRKIRGYKVLVMGNHDKGASNYKRKKNTFFISKSNTRDETLQWTAHTFPKDKITVEDALCDFWAVNTDNCLFDEVYEGAVMIAPNIILSHEPIPNFPYAQNLHGHCHNRQSNQKDHFNLCAELIDYTPVPLSFFADKVGFKHIIDIHQETVDRATVRKKMRKKLDKDTKK